MDDMNCLEARRIITTDIKDKSERLAQHLSECPVCKGFYDRQVKLNSTLKEALEVDVPEGLEARILLQQSLSQKKTNSENNSENSSTLKKALEVDVPEGLEARILLEHKLNQKKTKSRNNRWLAMAASVMLVVSVSMVSTLHAPPALAGAIVEHINEDIKMYMADDDIAPAELNKLLHPHGVKINAGIGYARSAGNCLIDDKLAAHIVFEGKNSLVTLIVIPEKISDNRIEFDKDNFEGMMVSTPRGTLALVAEDKETLIDFERRLQTSLVASL